MLDEPQDTIDPSTCSKELNTEWLAPNGFGGLLSDCLEDVDLGNDDHAPLICDHSDLISNSLHSFSHPDV